MKEGLCLGETGRGAGLRLNVNGILNWCWHTPEINTKSENNDQVNN